jgi:transcriptional regulator with XRE-family HTH domain
MPRKSVAGALTWTCGACHKSGMTAAERLGAFMEWRGWSIAEFARESELDHSTISKILAGKRSAGIAAAVAIEAVTEREKWSPGPIRAVEWTRIEAHSAAAGGVPPGDTAPLGALDPSAPPTPAEQALIDADDASDSESIKAAS